MTRWIEPPIEPPDDYYDDGNCMDFTCDEEEKAWYEGWWNKEDWGDEKVENGIFINDL